MGCDENEKKYQKNVKQFFYGKCQAIVTFGFCKISVTSWFLGFSLPVRVLGKPDEFSQGDDEFSARSTAPDPG